MPFKITAILYIKYLSTQYYYFLQRVILSIRWRGISSLVGRNEFFGNLNLLKHLSPKIMLK